MTRFKELKRIGAAIERNNQPELRWALGYCTMRIQIATRKDQLKHWRQLENKVKAVLNTLEKDGELKTIFVRLLDEGTDVWRPVEAIQIDANTFQIASDNPSPEDEIREFGRGQNVKCKEVLSEEGDMILVAVALATAK